MSIVKNPSRPTADRKIRQALNEHKIYTYLLKGLAITRPNQVWCTDISYIPMRRGFLYLVVIMDWHSRKVLS
jgi:putative transposase